MIIYCLLKILVLDAGDGLSNTTDKRSEKTNSTYINRLSVISSESGKNSSESVDIITCSTECTTSPESDVLSLGQSISTSSSALGNFYKIIFLFIFFY